MTDLTGRHAMVTGGGSGIGRAIAVALASSGATVTVTGRHLEALEETRAQAPRIWAVPMDVADESSVIAAFATARKHRGPVDILVANAGIAETVPLTKNSLAFWRQTMAINLDGAFLCCREVLPDMLEQGWGRIIATASVAGLRGVKYGAAYAASKHGLLGLTRSIAEECKDKGVTANALCPGFVRTSIVSRSVEAIVKRSNMTPEDAERSLLHSNRQARLIEVEEVATAVLRLCDADGASVNGEAIEISGGQT